MMRALALIVVAGCWSKPPPTAPTSVGNAATRATPQPVRALPPHTVWIGRYECGQGVTALQLTLDVDPNGRATAIFDFGPLADNPTVPSGSYTLRGNAEPTGDAITVSLEPDRWISQPENYVMVPLLGGIDADRRRMRGRILNDACSWLDIKRAD